MVLAVLDAPSHCMRFKMYDHTLPAIVAKYNASAANYSAAMGAWVSAFKQQYPKVGPVLT